MKRKLLKATICKTGTGFSAHIENVPGVVTTGKTIDDIKKKMYHALVGHITVMRDDGDPIPEIVQDDYKLVFKMDVESLLEYYQGILTQSAIARITGINNKQLNHYATGKSKPRPAQIRKIEQGLHKLGAELMQINL